MTVSGWETAVWDRYKASVLRELKMLDKALTLSKPGHIKQKLFVPKNKLPSLDEEELPFKDYTVSPLTSPMDEQY